MGSLVDEILEDLKPSKDVVDHLHYQTKIAELTHLVGKYQRLCCALLERHPTKIIRVFRWPWEKKPCKK